MGLCKCISNTYFSTCWKGGIIIKDDVIYITQEMVQMDCGFKYYMVQILVSKLYLFGDIFTERFHYEENIYSLGL